MATHSSILALEIPQTEEPGRHPWGHKRVRHDLPTKTATIHALLLLLSSFLHQCKLLHADPLLLNTTSMCISQE